MSEPAQRLLVEVQQGGLGRRVPLRDVWSAFYKIRPHLAGSVHARGELREMLAALADSGALKLPRLKRSYDAAQKPPLPNWIQLPAPPPTERALKRAAEVGWHPALAFVTRLDRLSDSELEELLAVQAFLRDHPEAPEVTVRERSFEIFGDDKRLEELLAGRLFRSGGLTLSLLRCVAVHAPCVFRNVGTGTGALIVENKDTFHSACEAVRKLGSETAIRWVVFGSGRGILTTLDSICDWPARPERAWYFGDVDAAGLETAVQVVRIAKNWSTPLAVDCPSALYRSLVDRAATRHPALKGTTVSQRRAAELAEWLPEDLRPSVIEMLKRGGRWPQEAVAGDRLRAALRKTELLT